MKEKYRKALVEVYEILKISEEESLKKIPKKFLEFVKENKSDTYIFQLESNKSLSEQNLLHETKVVLATIYREYLADAEEKQTILKKQIEELEKIENQKIEKYNSEKLFDKEIKKDSRNQENVQLLEKKQEESFIIKVINKVKNAIRRAFQNGRSR